MPRLLTLLLLTGCASLRGQACECPVQGHAAMFEGQCACLPSIAVPPDQDVLHNFFVDPDVQNGDGSAHAPWSEIDWVAVDTALADGPTAVWISASEADDSGPEQLPTRLRILRSDPGPHRLIIDGRSRSNTSDTQPVWVDGTGMRARVPGVLTPYEGGPYSHITVRGFEVTDSADKGVYWRSGDEVILEDLHIHDNRGSPAVNLEYSNRSGHRSTRFVVRNNHVYNQPGECIYIGGSEGEDEPSHVRVEVVNNLVHHCRSPYDSKHDGINVKDRIEHVVVERNVVFRTDWGIEVASPGRYTHNVVADTDREGFQVSDSFSPIGQMLFEHNVVVNAGHDAFHLVTDKERAQGMRIAHTSIFAAKMAGILVGGEIEMDLVIDDVVVADSAVGFDGWGQGGGQVLSCATSNNEADSARVFDDVVCDALTAPAIGHLAGPDGLWLTADDPAYLQGHGAQPPP